MKYLEDCKNNTQRRLIATKILVEYHIKKKKIIYRKVSFPQESNPSAKPASRAISFKAIEKRNLLIDKVTNFFTVKKRTQIN